MKRIVPLLLALLLLAGCAEPYDGPTESQLVLSEHYTTYTPGEPFDPWTTRYSFTYDIYGNVAQTRNYRDDELDSENSYTYDENGNLLTDETWDHTGWLPTLVHRREYTYDAQNRVLTEVTRDFWGRETARTEHIYDDEARTETVTYESGVSIRYFDENGNTLRSIYRPRDGSYTESEDVYTYDENGNRLTCYSYRDGVLESYWVDAYDGQNRLIHSASYLPDGTLEREWRYEYNDEANSKICYKPNGTRREEYYLDDGQLHAIKDYDEYDNLTMNQHYSYREILVPANGEE